MAYYYYLISSLPSIKFDYPLPISYAQFLNQCEKEVSDSILIKLKHLTLEANDDGIPLEWSVFYSNLYNELNYQRALKLNRPQLYKKQDSLEIVTIVNQVLSAKNPLDAEIILLKSQFEFLDKIISTHYFDLQVLMVYAIKIKLKERYDLFNKESGKKEFKNLFMKINNIMQEL